MDYRTQKELLGETRLSALFSPLLANRWLWLEAILIPIIGIGLCWLVSPEDPFFKYDLAKRLLGTFPDATLVEFRGASTFVSLDQPEKLATTILDWVG